MIKVVNLIGPLCKDINAIDKSLDTVLVDGAFKWHEYFKSNISVGDGDSLDHGTQATFNFPYPSDKDETDLKLSLLHLNECFEFDTIRAYGLSGERFDHELASLFEMAQFMNKIESKKIKIYFEDKIKCIIYSKGSFNLSFKGTFSLLSLFQGDISLTGSVKYPITSAETSQKLTLTGLGISNFASGDFNLTQNIASLFFPIEKLDGNH